MGQNGNGLKTDKNGNRTEVKRERNRIARPVVRTGDGNLLLTPTVPVLLKYKERYRRPHDPIIPLGHHRTRE